MESAIWGGVVALGVALILWLTKTFWEWLHAPYSARQSIHLPRGVRALRRWATTEPREKLTATQWFRWYVYCPVEGHEFPRGLPNDAGRWNDGGLWYGVCRKCSAVILTFSEEDLDKAEREGRRAHRSRKKKTLPAKSK